MPSEILTRSLDSKITDVKLPDFLIPISDDGDPIVKYRLPDTRAEKDELTRLIIDNRYTHCLNLRYTSDEPGVPGGYSWSDMDMLVKNYGEGNVLTVPEAGAFPDPKDPSNLVILHPVDGGIAVFVKYFAEQENL